MTEQKRLAKNKQISQTKRNTIERHSKMLCHTYSVKVQYSSLSKEQKENIQRMFLEAKWLKNYIISWTGFLTEDEEYKKAHKIYDFDAQGCKLITKKDSNFKDVEVELSLHSMIKAQIKQDLCSNIKTIKTLKTRGFQKSGGALKFVKEVNSIPLKKYGFTHKILSSKRVKIAGLGRKGLLVNGLKQFTNIEGLEIANARLLRKANGLYIQFITYQPKADHIEPKNGKIIGIDFGCSTSFTTSEGEKINVKIRESERLKRLQRNLSRKEKGSKNFYKNVRLIKVEYLKNTNKKNEQANQLVHKLSKYETVVIQDEMLPKWQHSGHGKAIQHSILGRVKAKLKLLPNVYIIEKSFPTTKLCRKCGAVNDSLKLFDRQFICNCGVVEDRDIHAAKNMVHVYNIRKIRAGTAQITPVEIEINGSKNLILTSKKQSQKQEGARLLI